LKIKILSQKYNPLLKRKEVIFEVNHSQEGQTTPRLELRKNLANMLKAKIDLVFVEKMETKTGTTTALGEANAYETAEQAKLVEREHIITRNILPEKAEEEAETEKPKTQEIEEKKPTKEEKAETKKEATEKPTSAPKPEKEAREEKKEE
jgi:small subunit ribosomal protein S24e